MDDPPPSPNPLPTTEGVTHEWQDIATAPMDGTAVLCFDGECDRIFVGSYMRITSTGKMAWAANVRSFVVFQPSHWMPLPPPPGKNT